MTTRLAIAAACLAAFIVLATANSAGYRYGVSDQAYHVPAVARLVDPALFPRDGVVLDAQSSRNVGDDLIAALAGTPDDLPRVFAALYVASLALLAAAGAFVARGLRMSPVAVTGVLALMTIRHHIAGTGANSLEGYMNPRMMALAVGVFSLGYVLRRRWMAALLLAAAAGVIHPTTGAWVGAAALAAWAAAVDRRLVWACLGAGATGALGLLAFGQRMDAAWLEAIAGKDYLFVSSWSIGEWTLNLLYPGVLWLIYQRRHARGLARPGEGPLLVGLAVLVVGFLLSVPLAAAHVALAVQAQVNRVFWILAVVAIIYLGWWLVDDLAARRGRRWPVAAVIVLAVLSAARGAFVLTETGRPLARVGLERTAWTSALAWIQSQPEPWHVLADPGHAWKYGTSVRVGARRDTVLELVKDSALAMYDRDVALRVSDRTTALGAFDDLKTDGFVELARRYDADVLIVPRSRAVDLPLLHANDGFAVYRLR